MDEIVQSGTPHLNAALAKARGMFDWEQLRRDGTGHYGKYLTLAKIYEATSAGLSENGLSLSHRIMGATIHISLRHASGEAVESEMPLGQPKQWQEYGKSMSYATRYGVQALLGIAGGEDLETDIAGLQSNVPYQAASPSQQQSIADGTYEATFEYIEKNPNRRSENSPVASATGTIGNKEVYCPLWGNHIEKIATLRGKTKTQLEAALEKGRVVLNPALEASVSVAEGRTRIHIPEEEAPVREAKVAGKSPLDEAPE